jgi:glutaredoxin-like protein NrdH
MSIVIYSTPSCSPCRVLKHLLNKKGLPFEVKDLNDPKNLREVQKYTEIASPPITIVNGKMVLGTKVSEIERIYRGE